LFFSETAQIKSGSHYIIGRNHTTKTELQMSHSRRWRI